MGEIGSHNALYVRDCCFPENALSMCGSVALVLRLRMRLLGIHASARDVYRQAVERVSVPFPVRLDWLARDRTGVTIADHVLVGSMVAQ